MTQQQAPEASSKQIQGEENPEVQIPQVPTTIIAATPMIQLVPFIQEKWEEVPHFNTVYYDRATKRIMRRTERKVEAEGMASKMITDKVMMVGTYVDPRFTIRAGTACFRG